MGSRSRFPFVMVAVVVVVAVGGGAAWIGADRRSFHGTPHKPSPATRSTTTSPSASTPASSAPAPPGASPGRFTGPFAVGTGSILLSEPVPAGSPAGTQPRLVPTDLRYPFRGSDPGQEVAGATPDRSDGPYPLVIFSQGFDISASAYAPMMDSWAEAGYVVAEPIYPDTDPSDPSGVDRSDLVNHPADLRFVISALIGEDTTSTSVLDGIVDTSEIVVAGQSDGGDVSLADVANSSWRDPSIRAAMILSGAEYAPFGGSYFSEPAVPLLVTQGTDDDVNPPVCSNQIFDSAPQPTYYVQLLGSDHLDPYTTADGYARVVDAVTVDFLDGITRDSPGDLARIASDGSVSGVAAYVPAGSTQPLDGTCPGAP